MDMILRKSNENEIEKLWKYQKNLLIRMFL